MNCPICNQSDEMIWDKTFGVWRCDRCNKRFVNKAIKGKGDTAETFIILRGHIFAWFQKLINKLKWDIYNKE